MQKNRHGPCQAEHEARAFANHIIARGASNAASDDERRKAATVSLVLSIAERQSGLVDQTAFDALLAEISEWGQAAEAKILDMVEQGASQAEIDLAVQQFVAKSEVKQRHIEAWLQRQGEDAWKEAERRLRKALGASVEGRPN